MESNELTLPKEAKKLTVDDLKIVSFVTSSPEKEKKEKPGGQELFTATGNCTWDTLNKTCCLP